MLQDSKRNTEDRVYPRVTEARDLRHFPLQPLHKYIPHSYDVADGTGEDEEMEDGVHEAALAQAIKQGTGNVADAFGYYPYHG